MRPHLLRRALTVLSSSAALLICAAPAACSAPSFADKAATGLRKSLPGYQVTVVDDLTLRVGKPSEPADKQMQVNLDRIADFCHRSPGDCQSVLSDYIARTVDMVKAKDVQPTLASLRAVVRPAIYADQIAQMMGAHGRKSISAPLVGDLVVICYIDMPTTMEPASEDQLAKLGVPPQSALDRCRSSTRAALPNLTQIKPARQPIGKKGAIIVLAGDSYESSYLALHDEWSSLAAAFGGHLLAAAPDADQVLVTPDQGPDSVRDLSTLARQGFGTAERPISQAVYRWTPAGWEVAAP